MATRKPTKTRSAESLPSGPALPANLLAPRVNTLSKFLIRNAVKFAKEEFALSQTEWQVVALLGVLQPISIRELAYQALRDAAQISRAIASLAERGYIERKRSEADSREAQVSLSQEGASVYRHLAHAAIARNALLIEGYSPRQIQQFVSMMDVFIERARQAVEEDGF
ncbi:MarR family winged helix-turn-helix transcriptional regulator [Pusillimonas caeni]|uniref:MarR family winged helix-turn-helix transcriptional regulator n=1 Tax=Pusillimonas caeni TaxID=1348472 RepID=UPI00142F75B8|nr:MarR family transcriptional regulator [Pusillimonas caeni]